MPPRMVAKESGISERAGDRRALIGAGGGAALVGVSSATLSWVVCCATPTWVVSLAMLGMSASLALWLEPLKELEIADLSVSSDPFHAGDVADPAEDALG